MAKVFVRVRNGKNIQGTRLMQIRQQISKMVDTIDKRTKRGDNAVDIYQDVNNHMTVDDNGNRVWSY